MGIARTSPPASAIKPFRVRRSTQVAPASFYWWPITEAKIRRAAQKLVDELQPEKIILFGSFAYGHPTIDSDVDLLIVMRSKARPVDRIRQASAVLDPRPFPVDIIVRTPAEIAERLRIRDCFIEEIVTKGKVLYERSSQR
jgi:predicted nucleotidyltransferase